MTTYNIPPSLTKNSSFFYRNIFMLPSFCVCVFTKDVNHITYSCLWGQYTQHLFQYKAVRSGNLSSFKLDFLKFCV